MDSASDARWRAAQNAERAHAHASFHSWKLEELRTHSHFFSQKFLLGSEFFNDKNILEVGCGPAVAIHGLGQAGLRLGIDPLAGELRHFYPNSTNNIRGMGEYLPFKDETFDVVLCVNVLDHVQNPFAVLKEMQRCLKRGGTLVLWLQTFHILRAIRKALSLVDAPHPHHFRDSDVSFMLQEIGYNIDYRRYERASLNSSISVIKQKLIISGLKSLLAILFLGLHESSYMCSKTS
ncbi:class I SAM-dependent methyltransferase [Candidatus Bathyarchaeota archaeon]|nr:class I SAM-dependent methyltransferase [Candidatus Bathyarchaeota archaeon]